MTKILYFIGTFIIWIGLNVNAMEDVNRNFIVKGSIFSYDFSKLNDFVNSLKEHPIDAELKNPEWETRMATWPNYCRRDWLIDNFDPEQLARLAIESNRIFSSVDRFKNLMSKEDWSSTVQVLVEGLFLNKITQVQNDIKEEKNMYGQWNAGVIDGLLFIMLQVDKTTPDININNQAQVYIQRMKETGFLLSDINTLNFKYQPDLMIRWLSQNRPTNLNLVIGEGKMFNGAIGRFSNALYIDINANMFPDVIGDINDDSILDELKDKYLGKIHSIVDTTRMKMSDIFNAKNNERTLRTLYSLLEEGGCFSTFIGFGEEGISEEDRPRLINLGFKIITEPDSKIKACKITSQTQSD